MDLDLCIYNLHLKDLLQLDAALRQEKHMVCECSGPRGPPSVCVESWGCSGNGRQGQRSHHGGGRERLGIRPQDACRWGAALCWLRASLGAQWQRIRLPVQEMWVQSLGQEDPLQKEMATHSSILAWEIPWTEEPGGLESKGLQKSWTRLND